MSFVVHLQAICEEARDYPAMLTNDELAVHGLQNVQ